MHPLARFLIPVGIALLVIAVLWWVLGPLAAYLAKFWPALAIAIGIGLLLWRFPTAQAQALLGAPLIRGTATALILTAIYGGLLWLGFVYLPKVMIVELGISLRSAWLLITILGLPVIPIIWRLYAATGIPGDPVSIGRAFRGLALLILIFMGWWYHHQPNIFFDKAGKSQFWVAKSEGKVYFRPGHSPSTGETLIPGTPEDAKRFGQQSWLNNVKWWRSDPMPPPPSKARAGWTETVRLQPGCWSAKVFPPPGTTFTFAGPINGSWRIAGGKPYSLGDSDRITTRDWNRGVEFFSPTGGEVRIYYRKT